VCKTPSPQDNRSYQLALTQKGKQLLEEGFKQFLKTIELLKSQMGTDNFLLFLQQLKTANKILMENK
jgi:DNA-binding MarR family transcriptional regulator